MSKIGAIAANTFREAIRNKILYALLFFAVLLILGSIVIARLSLHEEVRVVQDLGLTAMSLFSVIIAVFIGVNLVYKELEKKTIYVLISKPLSRHQFLLGKYLGIMWTMAVLISVMATVLCAMIASMGGVMRLVLFKAIWLCYVEIMVLSAVALFFSSFSSPFVSGLLTLMIFVLGRSTVEVRELLLKMGDTIMGKAISAFIAVTPHLHLFNIGSAVAGGKNVAIHTNFVSTTYLLTTTAYGFFYSLLALGFAMLVFRRKDFT